MYLKILWIWHVGQFAFAPFIPKRIGILDGIGPTIFLLFCYSQLGIICILGNSYIKVITLSELSMLLRRSRQGPTKHGLVFFHFSYFFPQNFLPLSSFLGFLGKVLTKLLLSSIFSLFFLLNYEPVFLFLLITEWNFRFG